MSSTYCAAVYDANGYHKIIVNPSFDFELDNDGFNPAGCVQARILRSTFEALDPPVFIDGVVYYHALNKAVVAQVTSLNAVIGARLQAIIDATTIALGVSAVTTPLITGNSLTVDGVTYFCSFQVYNGVSDAPGFDFGDWPGHTGAIKLTATGGGTLISGSVGEATLTLEFLVTSASAIMNGARVTFVASTADSAHLELDGFVADDAFSFSDPFTLSKSEDTATYGPDVLSWQETFAAPQTSIVVDMSNVGMFSGAGSISYATLSLIV